MAQHNEIEFEKELAEHLAANGWLYSANDDGYDKERALFPEDVQAAAEQALHNAGVVKVPTDPAAEPWPPMRAGTGL